MKLYSPKWFVPAYLWLSVVLCSPAWADSNGVVDISSLYYPPIVYEHAEPEMGYGIGRDIVTAALEAAGYQPRYHIVPMVRNTWSLISGKKSRANLGVTRWFKNQKQAHLIEHVDIFDMRFVFFYKKERFPDGLSFETLSELKPYTIGNVRGSLTTKLLSEESFTVVYVKQVDQVIRMLASDRIDLAVAVDLAGWKIINDLYPGGAFSFATVERPVITEPLALIFRKGESELKQRFSTGLQQIMHDGQFTDIVHRYYSSTDIEISNDILSKIPQKNRR
jgi:polar amino acid transport system substrate-binding protein